MRLVNGYLDLLPDLVETRHVFRESNLDLDQLLYRVGRLASTVDPQKALDGFETGPLHSAELEIKVQRFMPRFKAFFIPTYARATSSVPAAASRARLFSSAKLSSSSCV